MPLKYGLIEPTELAVAALPRPLEGLRIAHLSDMHITRPRRRFEKLAEQLTRMRLDLVFFTGDYMTRSGDEPFAFDVLADLSQKLRPSIGLFGVFGNHDTAKLREMCRKLPIHWLDNAVFRLPDKPMELFGVQMLKARDPDVVSLALDWVDRCGRPIRAGSDKPLRLMLSHVADTIVTAADMGIDVVFAGHTHGGQCRLPGGRVLVNSSDLPLNLTTGLLRCKQTLAVVSRGLGEVGLPLRVCCPPHVPVYTLRRQTLGGEPAKEPASRLHRIWPW